MTEKTQNKVLEGRKEVFYLTMHTTHCEERDVALW